MFDVCMLAHKWCHWWTNQLIGHLIIIKQPERFPKSNWHPKSMNKLTLNEPAINLVDYFLSINVISDSFKTDHENVLP